MGWWAQWWKTSPARGWPQITERLLAGEELASAIPHQVAQFFHHTDGQAGG